MIVFIVIITGAFFIVGMTTPPNNSDSLNPTHLTRIYYWIQHNSIDSESLSISQLTRPMNGHIQLLWLFLLGHSENLFFLLQWFSLLVVLVSVYKAARQLDFSTTQALVCSIVCLSFPVALLQTYSSQGDLTTTALITISLSLAISYLITHKAVDLIGAGLALGLSLGTKNPAFLTLPIIGITILIFFLKKRTRKFSFAWIGVGLLILILATGFHFIKNIKETGNFFGNQQIITNTEGGTIFEKVKYNGLRHFYKFIGFDGLPRFMYSYLNEGKGNIFRSVLEPVGINLESEQYLQPGADPSEYFSYSTLPVLTDDQAWFGPLAVILITPAIIASLLSKQKHRRYYAMFCVGLFVSFLLMELIQRPGWDPYQGRYFLIPIIPMVPMVSILIPQRKIPQKILIWLIIILAAFLSINTYCSNDSKPVVTVKSYVYLQENYVNKLPDETAFQKYIKKHIPLGIIAKYAHPGWNIYHFSYLERVYFTNQYMAKELQWINSIVPENAPIYHMIINPIMEYGLFGKNKTRNLYPVNGIEQVGSGYYLTVAPIMESQIPNGVEFLASNGKYSIYYFPGN